MRTSATTPTTIRMTPIASRFRPDGSSVTPHVRMAPAAIRIRPIGIPSACHARFNRDLRGDARASATAALARLLGGFQLGQRGAAVVPEREVGLGDEADRRQRERQRASRELPALQRPRIGELRLLLVRRDLEHRKAAMRLADEVVVRDDLAALRLADVAVEEVVRPAALMPSGARA